MAKPLKRKKARSLRTKGESIKVIAKLLKVSPSTVSRWCADIKLTESQIKELERRRTDPLYGNRLRYAQKQKQKRILKAKRLKMKGKKEIGILTKRELFLVGAALYWAEGFKKDSQVGFASSDPRMIQLFIKWLKISFDYNDEDFILRVTVNISHKYRIRDIEEYWSQNTGVSRTEFRKPFYQKVKWKKIYDNPEEYYGVLRIKVRRSKDFLRKIRGYIVGLAEAEIVNGQVVK